MVVEENTMGVPVRSVTISLGVDYLIEEPLHSTIIMLLARRALFLARLPRPYILQSKLIHSVAQTDRVLSFPSDIVLFLFFFLTGNNHSPFVLHRNQTRG
jgi:hypothetical protein